MAVSDYIAYIRHQTFSFKMSLPAVSFADRFCVNRKGRTMGGGWVHPKGASSMAVSWFIHRKALVGTRRAISVLFGINGHRNELPHLVGPPFPAFKRHVFFQLLQAGIFFKSIDLKSIKWRVWLQSCICLGWLKEHLSGTIFEASS